MRRTILERGEGKRRKKEKKGERFDGRAFDCPRRRIFGCAILLVDRLLSLFNCCEHTGTVDVRLCWRRKDERRERMGMLGGIKSEAEIRTRAGFVSVGSTSTTSTTSTSEKKTAFRPDPSAPGPSSPSISFCSRTRACNLSMRAHRYPRKRASKTGFGARFCETLLLSLLFFFRAMRPTLIQTLN